MTKRTPLIISLGIAASIACICSFCAFVGFHYFGTLSEEMTYNLGLLSYVLLLIERSLAIRYTEEYGERP